jgi:lipopolysaccharide export system protein LptC
MTEPARFPAAQRRSLLLVALLTSLTLALYLYSARLPRTASGHHGLPELYVDQPDWRLFDERGVLVKQLRAERLEKLPGEDAVRLLEPRLSIQDQRRRQWRVTARRGRYYEDDRPLLLEHGVVLRRPAAEQDLELKSAWLRVSGQGARIETDAPVVLRTGSWHFRAVGLRADLGRQHLELLRRVRGTHE